MYNWTTQSLRSPFGFYSISLKLPYPFFHGKFGCRAVISGKEKLDVWQLDVQKESEGCLTHLLELNCLFLALPALL